jgi:rsbT co-antagonist protein RsbR
MRNRLYHWFTTVALRDPIQRRQAVLIQIMYIVLMVGAFLWVPISLGAFVLPIARLLTLLSSVSVVACTLLALIVLRRGHFTVSVALATTGIFLAVAIVLVVTGLRASGGLLFVFALPMTLAGLLLGQRGLLIFSGLCVLTVTGLSVLEYLVPWVTGFGSLDEPISVVGTVTLAAVMLSFFLGSFGATLREALTAALAREQELHEARSVLEQRTTLLQEALQIGKQREVRLAETVEELHSSQAALQALSAPVIPVLPGVLIAPLIGTVDQARATALIVNVLGTVERLRAQHVIFDVTGVSVIDMHVVQTLHQATAAIRLLGARVQLVGIRPEVAQTIVASGSDLSAITTYPSLQEAIMTLIGPHIHNRSMLR